MEFNQLSRIFPKTKNEKIALYLDPLNNTFNRYEIDTVLRQCAFLAQVGHESGELNITKENLNYSAKGLKSVFKKYFPGDLAEQYARNPEKIANRVYANRMGNGDEDSGDGWKYRGRGLIQITGKNNYTLLAKEFELSLDEVVSWLETSDGATLSAGWFWNERNLNKYADLENIITITKKINGGLNGIDDRKRLYKLAKDIMGVR